MTTRENIVLLVGGVGGAKLAVGLAHILPPEALTIVVNTADDFEHLGLHISPDLDTVMYTLAGLANPQTGWGIVGETFAALEMVSRYGGPDWFRLGDRDLATHLIRTSMLRGHHSLTDVTQYLCQKLNIAHPILPMSNDKVRTWLETSQGRLSFQDYFVQKQWQPIVHSIEFEGAAVAQPSLEVMNALENARLIIFGPSNPFLSIDPILAVPTIRDSIKKSAAPIVAVSPIIGGKAVKGPAAKLMDELGYTLSPVGVVDHYSKIITGFIVDETDSHLCELIEKRSIKAASFKTYMTTLLDKINLATFLMDWTEGNLL